MNIGKGINRIRLKHGLTQQELADRCELTKGYISQVESDTTSPSIGTLTTLLQALGTDLSEFFQKEKDTQVIFKKENMCTKFENERCCSMTWIIPNSQKNIMEPVIVELEYLGRTMHDKPHNGEEFGYILEGMVEVVLNGKKYKAKKGQGFYYNSDTQHYIINKWKKKAKILWVSSPPYF